MTNAPRSVTEALAYARSEHEHETYDWTGYCQKFVRCCYGIPALYGSAWAQWLSADDADKHVGGSPDAAPVGAALCFKGSGPYGHIMLAARDGGAWSNDLVRSGDIDYVDRSRPTTQWGQQYLGYLTAVNEYDLDLTTGRPPKPRETKRYKNVFRAIKRIEVAAANAEHRGDHADAKVLRAERRDLKELYAELRHA